MKCIKKCTIQNIISLNSLSSNACSINNHNTLRFLPPLTITNEEIDLGFTRLNKAVSNIK